jgi:hypothetical protein
MLRKVFEGYQQLCGPRGDWENLRRQGAVLLHALQTGVVFTTAPPVGLLQAARFELPR